MFLVDGVVGRQRGLLRVARGAATTPRVDAGADAAALPLTSEAQSPGPTEERAAGEATAAAPPRPPPSRAGETDGEAVGEAWGVQDVGPNGWNVGESSALVGEYEEETTRRATRWSKPFQSMASGVCPPSNPSPPTTMLPSLTVLGPCACAVRQVLQAAAVPH